jgi:tripartite-type tricarboxylate transporter receptor subunit TctC
MKFPRRQFLHLAAGAVSLPAVLRMAMAESYPSRYVRLIVPFAPGGGMDAVAHPLAYRLSEVWGQQVVIENKAGAGSTIGIKAAAQSAPDGYTLLIAGNNIAYNDLFYPSPGYDPVRDFAPVADLCSFPNLMVVPNSSPAKSVTQFIDYAMANQGKISYASSGTGTSVHLSGELFKRMAGIEMTHVPYRGVGPALNDLIAGRVDVMFGTMTGTWLQAQSGALRALAVTSNTRSPFAPDIPTVAESGLPEFDVSSWYAIFLPVKTPTEIVKKVHYDVALALAHPSVKQGFEAMGIVASPSSPAELRDYLKAEMTKWGPIIKAAGIKAE